MTAPPLPHPSFLSFSFFFFFLVFLGVFSRESCVQRSRRPENKYRLAAVGFCQRSRPVFAFPMLSGIPLVKDIASSDSSYAMTVAAAAACVARLRTCIVRHRGAVSSCLSDDGPIPKHPRRHADPEEGSLMCTGPSGSGEAIRAVQHPCTQKKEPQHLLVSAKESVCLSCDDSQAP